MERFDAVVVGGGPAGSAFAIALASAGRSVALIDRSASPGPRSVDLLPPGARPILEELGVWERFRADGHVASPGILSAWGQEQPVSQDFIWSPYGPGWHVDRRRFDAMLVHAAQRQGAAAHQSTRVTRVTDGVHDGRRWLVEAVTDGSAVRMSADFLIEATGRGPSLARRLKVKKAMYDRLVGVVASVELPDARLDHRMLLEPTENGWWYSIPAPGSKLVVAWMTDPDLKDRAAGSLRHLWHRELDCAPHTRGRVPLKVVARVGVLAANSCCRPAAQDRWLAVGDAATAYDPLSGQGIVRALETGHSAATAVIAAQTGASGALDDYAAAVTEGFRQYLRQRRDYYAAEYRWPHAPFWQRRDADSKRSFTS